MEQYVRELQARGSDDPDALVALCETYWQLKRQNAAIETFKLLLRHLAPPKDRAFDEIYVAGLLATGTCPTPIGRRERLMQLVELLCATADVPGAVAECGCYLGLSSYLLCSFLTRSDPLFCGSGYHIFDSFQGLSEPTADDDVPDDWENAKNLRVMTQRGRFAAPLDEVKANLRDFPGITFHPGWIPLTFKGLPETRYRFVHVDVDLYDPTLDAFNYFYPRLSAGGVIASDDYSWPGARMAIDQFCMERGLALRVTACNQAVIQNRRAASESSSTTCS